MLVSFKDILETAMAGNYAVGYFEAWDIYSLEAVLEAAESENAPTIIGFGESMTDTTWFDLGGLERLAALGLAVAKSSPVPMSLIFNEVSSIEHAIRGIKAGYNAVMLDSAYLPLSKHTDLTRKLVQEAHVAGVGVEAELGDMPMAKENGSIGEGSLTDPKEAIRFVQETGIDALGVSVGNVHLLSNASSEIDLERLQAIHEAITIPLVLHGGTGFPDDKIPDAISRGVAKINVGTVLKQIFLKGICEAIESRPEKINIHELMGSRRDADIMLQGKLKMREEVVRRIRIYNPHLQKNRSFQ